MRQKICALAVAVACIAGTAYHAWQTALAMP